MVRISGKRILYSFLEVKIFSQGNGLSVTIDYLGKTSDFLKNLYVYRQL